MVSPVLRHGPVQLLLAADVADAPLKRARQMALVENWWSLVMIDETPRH